MELAVQRNACVAEDDEGRGRSSIRSTAVAKIKLKDLINDRQATERMEFIVRAGNIEYHCTQEL